MLDFQTFITILTALLVFLTGVFLSYDTLQLRNYDLPIPQWAGLLLAGITFTLVVLDQLLRGLVRFEEEQRRIGEEQRRVREENFRIEERERRISEARSREREIARAETDRIEERNRRLEETERQTRRTRIET